MKTILLTVLFLFASASAASAQQFEVRNIYSGEPWYVSICESSYTKYSGEAVFTYTVDSVISGNLERGFASLYYLNNSLVSSVFIHDGSLYENFNGDLLMLYKINPDTDIAGIYTHISTAKAGYTFPARVNQRRIPEPSTKQGTETGKE